MSAPARRQVGKWRLLNTVDNALRDAYLDPDHSAGSGGDTQARVVDCPYCARTVRPAPRGRIRVHGNPLRHALHDHLFDRCPVVEVRR